MDFHSWILNAVMIGALTACAGGAILARRAVNRRIRMLSLSIVLLVACEVSSTLVKSNDANSTVVAQTIEILQLMCSGLALSFVHLLNRENRDRRNTEMRLRLLESDRPGPGQAILTAK